MPGTRRASRADIVRSRALTAVWLVGVLAAGYGTARMLGADPALHLAVFDRLGASLHHQPQPPLLTGLPANTTTWLLLVAVAAAAWAVALSRVSAVLRRDTRGQGLPGWAQLRPLLSGAAARRSARWTRPALPWWRRRLPGLRAPMTDLGYRVGRHGHHQLWASFEYRIRIIARTGWGKTTRLLIPMTRDLPGAALVGTTAADLFEHTVTARGHRGPVWVVDFSDRAHRTAAGYPTFGWNPVSGCADYTVATRRATAAVAGAGAEEGENGYFRRAAIEVATAWLHAADLSGQAVDAVLRWQSDIHSLEPRDIIDLHSAAEPVAKTAMLKHLDERAARTTSNTERFLQLALAPFATRDGHTITHPAPGAPTLTELIDAGGTLYLLASPHTAGAVAPLLTMIADEWFYAARSLAQSLPGQRLPTPAVGVLDELRGFIPLPSLPTVVYDMRKYGIGVTWAVQNGGQEKELYGDAAESLATNTHITVIGGHDPATAGSVVQQSGQIEVTSVSSRGLLVPREFGESGGHFRPVIDHADLAGLRDGQAVLLLAGSRPCYATFPRPGRRAARRLRAEAAAVRAATAAAQATSAAERHAFDALAAAAWQAR